MIKKCIALFLLFSCSIHSQTTAILAERPKATEITLLWNSVYADLDKNIYCQWREVNQRKMKLESCYPTGNFWHFITMYFFRPYYKIMGAPQIFLDLKACTIKMDGEVIGRRYGFGCRGGHPFGIEITVPITLNELDLEITI